VFRVKDYMKSDLPKPRKKNVIINYGEVLPIVLV
jgi:hypothetical protein